MAERGIPELNCDNDYVAGLPNGKESQQQRSDTIWRFTKHHELCKILTIIESGWDANESLIHPRICIALQKAAELGWTEDVKMLLEAGAECKAIDGVNPMTLALHYNDYPIDLIRLLLKHGADPNDHHGKYDNIPLFVAIRKCHQGTDIVKLLLEHGADPNVTSQNQMYQDNNETKRWTALHEAARSGCMELMKMFLGAEFVTPGILAEVLALTLTDRCNNLSVLVELIELLLEQGPDVDYKTPSGQPLLHLLCEYKYDGINKFFQKSLDLFFQNGGDINMQDDIQHSTFHEANPQKGVHGTVLQCIVQGTKRRHGLHYANRSIVQARSMRCHANSNIVRWLIRHGADVSLVQFTWLKGYFKQHGKCSKSAQIPLILLEAGMRVPHGAHTQLSNMDEAIHTWLQEDTEDDRDLRKDLHDIRVKLWAAEEEELQMLQSSPKKSTFPEYRTVQMADLQEFSDESLNVYPEDECTLRQNTRTKYYLHTLTQIRRVLNFLSQPQSLQWHCRCCIRQNLVSLQPSVVKTLPLPDILKRYILCHEI